MQITNSLSNEELINLGLIFGAALVLAFGSILFRLIQLPYVDMPFNLRQVQYLIAFILVGLLPLLAIYGHTQDGKIASVFLIVAMSIGLLFPPSFMYGDLIVNAFVALSITFGGVIYFRFFDASITPLLAGIGALIGEFYLYGVAYLVAGVLKSRDLRLVVAIVALTVIVAAFGNILLAEYRKNVGSGVKR